MKLGSALLVLAKRFERLLRFGAVGAFTTGLYSVLTLLLIGVHGMSGRAGPAAIASLITLPIAYFAHRRFTYGDVKHDDAEGLRFLALGGFGLLMNVGLMQLSSTFRWPAIVGLALGWVLIPVCNFLLNSVLVFHTRSLLRLDRPSGASARLRPGRFGLSAGLRSPRECEAEDPGSAR